MRSQPDVTRSYESRLAWASTAVRERWVLRAQSSSVVGGAWCE